MNLWLARHARALGGEGICYGRTELEADAAANGAAASALAASLPACVQVRSSPLRRCRALAEALAELRPDLAGQEDPRLAELDFGCWEGRSWDAVPPEEFERWTSDFGSYRFGGRESVSELLARVAGALADLPAAGDVLWITHAGVIRAVRLLAGGAGLPRRAAEWPAAQVPMGGCERVVLQEGSRAWPRA